MNIQDIFKLLPHRYPILLVDRVNSVEEGKCISAQKNVTINEDFFNGHFPGHPIMPGVLIIEALAQSSGLLVMHSLKDVDPNDYLVYFMSIEEAHFRKPVVPGDVLILDVEIIKNRGNIWKMKGIAKVSNIKVADAVFSAMLVKREEK